MEKAQKALDIMYDVLGIAALTLALITGAAWLIRITQGYLLLADSVFMVVYAIIVSIYALVVIVTDLVISKKTESN